MLQSVSSLITARKPLFRLISACLLLPASAVAQLMLPPGISQSVERSRQNLGDVVDRDQQNLAEGLERSRANVETLAANTGQMADRQAVALGERSADLGGALGELIRRGLDNLSAGLARSRANLEALAAAAAHRRA